jgi:outer membrane lipoprotein SlyB
LVKLKGAGVSDTVIQRLMSRKGVAPAAMTTTAPSTAACHECGTVTGIQEHSKAGQASGVGAVAGGVVGGVLGRNLGGSKHRTAGTLLGAVGGGLAGHQIEKSSKSEKTWEISVRFDDGNVRVYTLNAQPAWTTGARVRLVNGALAPL